MKKILVVDDEENIRLLYKEELEDAGYQVALAGTAEEALEKIRKQIPDVITLDIKMPGMDGIEFMGKLKEENKNIPVILCSAFGQYKQDFRVWASDAYVVKSADLRELKLTIKKILAQGS
ncbi:MAG: two-component system response regulator [Nitrospinae bacterium CG11_big_fil_rev_8_21_14_0_20_56_8]|nr:MAG: two-component system response regulator [Nitrospinae bacterium CG11_big_fil_rev_8_21_14_0_20_56_8]